MELNLGQTTWDWILYSISAQSSQFPSLSDQQLLFTSYKTMNVQVHGTVGSVYTSRPCI